MKRYLFALTLSSFLIAPAFAAPHAVVPPPEGPLANALEVADALYADWSTDEGAEAAHERLLRLERATGASLVEHVEGALAEGAAEAVGEAALEQPNP